MKFDVVVGNPPYQENSGTSARDDALYNYFYDLADKIGEKYLLISPARFLFNAGSTPKAWNQKMLNDSHIQIVFYEHNSSKVFPNVGIAGGVVILYKNKNEVFGAIKSFTSFEELNKISQLIDLDQGEVLSSVISGRGIYRLTAKLHEDYPQIKEMQSKGHQNDIGTGAFDKFNNLIFFEEKPNDGYSYTLIQGRFNNTRTYRYIRSDYVNEPFAYDSWRVILPKAYGAGISKDGSAATLIGEPFVIAPNVGFTETYISIGKFDNEQEANNALKYIKGKFARTMLAVLKITQDNTKEKWSKVPLQDFTPHSDIDWSKSIPEIDQQLYTKYGFDQNDINFIEEKVKAMD
ncbi:Eco57I restriction-modification methylase domain-containing protein [Granulicatella seriolae]|uniref:Eco57I restriction-modification methylase domain-containing protein n=1 Tax=Granulicatella seriolae TaxID=2967226 RepID=A0ABT1WLJ4_9LACT|nr:Eco57I restriction-modification methylase domain-containing protein [Granulicatella seriolae]